MFVRTLLLDETLIISGKIALECEKDSAHFSRRFANSTTFKADDFKFDISYPLTT